MGYYVYKAGKSWDLKWEQGKKERRHVPKKSLEAQSLGFRSEMTLDEARARAKQLQAEAKVGRLNERALKRASDSKARREVLRSAYLTDADVSEFERKYVPEYKIRQPVWHTMQSIIVGVETHPSEWFELKSKLYAQFLAHKCSYNYAKKLLRYLNIWGYFLCKKQGRAFLKVPGLDGAWKNKLELARRPGGASKPLTPELLKSKRNDIPEAEYRWLYISVWFGLRPEEIDSLGTVNESRWYVSPDAEHGYVLSVFQKKLHDRGVAPEDCWKHLPCVFKEQRTALTYITEGGMQRPIGAGGKAMRGWFGPGFSPYAGRNNFSGLLREAGYDLETRKHWMGHLSIKTTESYDRKTSAGRAFFRPPALTKKAS